MISNWAHSSAASSTPGPGSYSLPDDFSKGPRYTVSKRPRDKLPEYDFANHRPVRSSFAAPKVSFGARCSLPKSFNTPGPRLYTQDFGKQSAKVSIGHKRLPEYTTDVPGPAEYSVNRDLPQRDIRIHEGKRTTFVRNEPMAKAGSYHLPSDFDNPKPMTIGAYKSLEYVKSDVPGPKYNVILPEPTPIKIKPRFEPPTLDDTPGPAEFQRLRAPTEFLPKQTLHQRTQLPQPELFTNNQFYVLPSTLESRRLSLGVRPSVSYETDTPGPAYYTQKSTLRQTGGHIGQVYETKREKFNTPGPGAYFKEPLPPSHPDPFCCLAGPSTREPEEIKHNAWKLAPGVYSEPDRFEEIAQPSTGCNFGGRSPLTFDID